MRKSKTQTWIALVNFLVIFIVLFLSGCDQKVKHEPAKEQWKIDHLDFIEYKCARCHWQDGAEKFDHSKYLGKKECTVCHYKKNLQLFKHSQLIEKEKCGKCHIPVDDMMHSVQKYCPLCHTTENWEKKKDT